MVTVVVLKANEVVCSLAEIVPNSISILACSAPHRPDMPLPAFRRGVRYHLLTVRHHHVPRKPLPEANCGTCAGFAGVKVKPCGIFIEAKKPKHSLTAGLPPRTGPNKLN